MKVNPSPSELIEGMAVETRRVTIMPGEALKGIVREGLSLSFEGEIDLREVPQSILQVPFILNSAPAVWALGLQCRVPAMDRDFYQALDEIREGFRTLYPQLEWNGRIEPENLVEDNVALRPGSRGNGRRILFFSGGVDSTYSALQLGSEGTTLLTVRGHDLALDNDAAWETARKQIRLFAFDAGFKFTSVSANIFRFLRYTPLHERFPSMKPWYGTVQHALSLVSLAFPLAACLGMQEVCFSSSNDAIVSHLPWGAHHLLEPRVRAAGISVLSIGADLDWIRKIGAISSYYKGRPGSDRPFLRVCLNGMSGSSAENCGTCVKCLRRATALLLFGEDPNRWGFCFPSPVAQTIKDRCERLNLTLFDTYYWAEMAQLAKDRFEGASREYQDFFKWLAEWKPEASIPSHNSLGGNP